MKIFQCSNCGQPLYFDNTWCEVCNSALGFDPKELTFYTAPQNQPPSNPEYTVFANGTRRLCQNHLHGACNWLADPLDPNGFCLSCRLNKTIPDLQIGDNLEAWRDLEAAKRRLVYSLLRFGLPLANKVDEPESGLAFDFLSEKAAAENNQTVLTGHARGLITININEADSVHRERTRRSMGEPYRTIIGHFRHEIGHYYWDRLIATDDQRLDQFRAIFGDERRDYAHALRSHYEQGADNTWPDRYISAYASAHPWEDWAEIWAHYMHVVDTLETALAFGIRIEPSLPNLPSQSFPATLDPYAETDMQTILSAALPLTLAVNSLNRGMGQPDLYPFVLPPPVLEKLEFIHGIIRTSSNQP